MSQSIQADTPLAAQLSSIVQAKLVDIGWSTGGPDDSALAEYIVLMLINGKTQEQMASELSNELLSLGPEDTAATDFAKWLFEQVQTLTSQPAGSTQPVSQTSDSVSQAVPSFSIEPHGKQARQQGDAGSADAEMDDAMDGLQDGSIPTGPKSMRQNPRPNSKRIVGQINKAMDRTNDSVLHRVRTPGSERINVHNRQPPKGPRAAGPPGRMNHGNTSGPPRGGHMGGRGGFHQSQPQISPAQQMQLLAFYEQQAKIMQSILSPGQQQAVMPGMPPMPGMPGIPMPMPGPVPAINPAFRHGMGMGRGQTQQQQQQQQGKSLFERVQHVPNGNFSHGHGRGQHHNHSDNHSHAKAQNTSMGDDTAMDVEGAPSSSEPSPDTICKFNLKCTKADCIFAHQSPAAPPGTTIDVHDTCPFGAACQNRKCVARHPSPAQRKVHQADQDCKFYPNCTNSHCPFRHPTMPMCRNGADCTREGCKFTHVKTMCRFRPCLNPSCHYKHEEGQKKGPVWKASEHEHVSERKFVSEEDGEEELILPGAMDASGDGGGGGGVGAAESNGEQHSASAGVEITT